MMASIPVEAVIEAGIVTVNSGSMIATFGIMSGLRRLTFMFDAGTESTAFLVTSLPVPEVVGTAIKGTGGFWMGRFLPTTSRYSVISPD